MEARRFEKLEVNPDNEGGLNMVESVKELGEGENRLIDDVVVETVEELDVVENGLIDDVVVDILQESVEIENGLIEDVEHHIVRDEIDVTDMKTDNLDNLRKLLEKQAAGAGEGAAGMSTIHMDDDEVPKLVVCDRRKDSFEPAGVSINGPSIAATPSIRIISLRMSVDSIVRDIPQMSKRNFWTCSVLPVRSGGQDFISLYRKLDLDPYPNFDKLCKYPTAVKLNLDFRAMR
ncbi:hypothetical protein Tco_1348351 [Tanacetum coccineum]